MYVKAHNQQEPPTVRDEELLDEMSAVETKLREALEEILHLAGRSGPPDNIEALNQIEATAKAVLKQ